MVLPPGERERRQETEAARWVARGQAAARAAEVAAGTTARLPARPQELTFEELRTIFERRRDLGQFTTGAELQAVGGILIPRLEKELKAARDLFQQRLEHPDLGPKAEETKEALEAVQKLERELVSLEVERIKLAKQLSNEYKEQVELLERVSLSLVEMQARARQAASALGIGVSEELFQPFLRSRLERGLSAAETQRTFASLRAQQDFTFARRRRDLEAELEDVQRGVRGGRIRPEAAAAEQFRIGQALLDLTLKQAAAQDQLNREERTAVTQAKERDTEGELNFLRQKLEILQSIGFEQAAVNVQARIGALEAEQQAAADVAGLSARQLQDLIGLGVQAIQSGRLSREAWDAMQARVDVLQARLRAIRQEEAEEAGEQAGLQERAQELARIYTDIIQPAIRTLTKDAQGIVDAVLKRTVEIGDQVVAAWAKMGKDAASAFNKAFTDEYGRNLPVPGQRPPDRRNELPGRTSSGINIYIGSADLTGKLSESAKRELAAAIMGATGDLAVQEERRMTGGSPVA